MPTPEDTMPNAPAPAWCDLHMHSTASDGTDDPADLPRLCKAAGLSAFALTDHDTVAGLQVCAEAARRQKIDFVPGIELSVDSDLWGTGKRVGALHILGHFIDPQAPPLLEMIASQTQARAERNPRIIKLLNEQGVRIDYEDVVALAEPGATLGRPHIAQVLVNKGYVKSIHEAFARYVGPQGVAYAQRGRALDAKEAIAGIHAAGGLATLAHPIQLKLAPDENPDDALEHVVDRLKTFGLDGIETRHSDHAPADTVRFEALAQRLNLLVSGGSDYHGSRKSIALGSSAVPRVVYEQLCAAVSSRRA
ncbi:MAG: PHP domain-containing protein [Algisphaera sp.]